MPIGYHITWNYVQGSVFGMGVSGMSPGGLITMEYTEMNLLTDPAFGPEGGLLVTAIVLLGFVPVWLYYRKKQFDFFSLDPQMPDGIADHIASDPIQKRSQQDHV